MLYIRDFWKHQESPIINGIVLPDGSIQLITISIDLKSSPRYLIELGPKTSISELAGKSELHWSSCATLTRLDIQEENLTIVAGEASYGSDGFVAVINSTTHELVWLAFFDCSNPFHKLEYVDKELYAWSTHEHIWRFPINEPSNVSVG